MVLFITLFGVGFVLLISSLIFGHDTDTAVDTDIDDPSHGPTLFSLKMVSLLMVGFGAMSFGVCATTEASMFVATMAGVGGALVVGIIGYAIIRAFYASQASSTIHDRDVIGSTATLIDAIPDGGRGQIACVVRGREITFIARSRDGRAISRDAHVRVVSKSGDVVIVDNIEN